MSAYPNPDPSFLPALLGWLVMLLAAGTGVCMSQRVLQRGVGNSLPWLLAGAAALGAGLWGSTVLGLLGWAGETACSFAAGWSAAALAAPAGLCLLGLQIGLTPAASTQRQMAGAASLGVAPLATALLVLQALGMGPAALALPGLLLVAWLLAACASGWALYALRRVNHRLWAPAAATMLFGAGMLGAQALVLAAAAPPAGWRALDDGIGGGTMLMLASVGVSELLLLMLLAHVVEARLRGRLDRAQTELQSHALRDELTGLPNRAGFEPALQRMQQAVDAGRGRGALLLVALDGFKQINEGFGHGCGDALLRCMAERLGSLVEPGSLARLGGDEFMLLVHGDAAGQEATVLATQIIATLSQSCSIDERELSIGCSVGVALYPQHGPASALLTHASVAMRTAKNGGGCTYAIFDPRMVVDQRDQAELLRDLRLALSRSQLELYYQPKVHAPSAQITGVEALLRWHHPQRGMISPAIFIPMAERSGLINKIGGWVIDEACRQARAWRDQGLRMRVAVNLSAHQLRQRDLPQHIAAALDRHQINPDLLTCEITESVAMEDTETTARFFAELDAVGVHISIDDFGSGYSSLAYLRKLPAGELKIDRSFVMDIAHSDEARTIAAAVVQLAQALKLKVVAEGVETDEQFQVLRQLGCDELQGFLFAKPMSARALGLWAAGEDGTRAVQFSESLFQESQTMPL